MLSCLNLNNYTCFSWVYVLPVMKNCRPVFLHHSFALFSVAIMFLSDLINFAFIHSKKPCGEQTGTTNSARIAGEFHNQGHRVRPEACWGSRWRKHQCWQELRPLFKVRSSLIWSLSLFVIFCSFGFVIYPFVPDNLWSKNFFARFDFPVNLYGFRFLLLIYWCWGIILASRLVWTFFCLCFFLCEVLVRLKCSFQFEI